MIILFLACLGISLILFLLLVQLVQITLNDDIITGFEKCLVTSNKNKIQENQHGVIVKYDNVGLKLYSTDGKRISKADPQIFACGSLDELSSFIGLTISETGKEKKLLSEIQIDLYQIMAFLSGGKSKITTLNHRIKLFEQNIDEISKKLPKLNCFILPQGTKIAAWFHVLRTVCRRAERVVVGYYNQDIRTNPTVLVYLNRLSDLFFVLARKYNQNQEINV